MVRPVAEQWPASFDPARIVAPSQTSEEDGAMAERAAMPNVPDVPDVSGARADDSTSPGGAARAGGLGLLIAAVVAAAALMRAPITAVPPSLDSISSQLHLSAAAAGATTSLPLLCFGIFAFLAPLLVARFGLERTMAGLLVPMVVGILLRSAGAAAAFFAGAVLVGVGIAIGNVILPALIRARFPTRVAVMMGVYVSVLQISGAVGSAVTVPLEEGAGWGWRTALAVWAVPVAVVLLLWIVVARRGPTGAPIRPPTGLGHVARRRLPWAITAFMALQAAVFYSLLTWLPAQLVDQGLSTAAAGAILGLYSLFGLPGAFLAPHFATGRHAGAFITCAYGLQVVAMFLFGLGPVTATIAALICGLCQGAGFSIALTFIADQPDPHDVPAISALAQGVGYLLAALGPVAVGALYAATTGWLAPNSLIAAMVVALIVLGSTIGRRIYQMHVPEQLIGR
ncbi:MAG: MFS transporter [Micrococcales bacterium]|nr:MFS transporter [Micrococcales bacterium]